MFPKQFLPIGKALWILVTVLPHRTALKAGTAHERNAAFLESYR
jgi:hypothetical protein